jgi:GNAT superfamily N-acetyltransferase
MAAESYFDQKWLRAQYRVIEHAGSPIGAVWTTHYADHIFLNEIQLLPAYQNRRIGTQLLQDALEQADQAGYAF